MSLTVKIQGGENISKRLSSLQKKLLTREVLGKMGGQAVTEIFERTVEKGQDKDGVPFDGYSDKKGSGKKYPESYKEYKQRRGGKYFSGGVNLNDEDKMMGDLTFTVEGKNRVFLHFPKSEENLKASGHIHGSRFLPKRDFFGLTKDNEEAVLKIPERYLKEAIDAANR